MEKRGRKNSGKQKDIERIEQLEEYVFYNDLGKTVTVSSANLKWLVEKSGLWVRRSEENEFN
ncbi:hypothetical protein [Sporosarcina sp. FSL K6-3457]|uniref:hypothetical protein n=1 Tax=Sporosarcina sp. FSL K6-3457 TaxID=2978204 RepID=UPI0030F65173